MNSKTEEEEPIPSDETFPEVQDGPAPDNDLPPPSQRDVVDDALLDVRR